jgi:dTDP-4-dehydrorhamnose 3,5-epimerase
MHLTKTPILGLFVIHTSVIPDQRGYFSETYHKAKFAQLGIQHQWVQENQSYSRQNTIRGLHYQLAPYAQAKLIRVLAGEIFDVAVDLRKGSPTFGQWEGVVLSATNHKQWLIPAGYAHGFSVLSEDAIVLYKCDALYYPEAEAGIHYLDKHLNIKWQLGNLAPIVSNKDSSWPDFFQASINFFYA